MKGLLPILLFFYSSSILSQSCRDASVELIADVQTNPPRITLKWLPNTSATGYFINRKLKTANSWGAVFATLPDTASHFVDTTALVGISYEYRVVRQAEFFTGYGYINSGINIAATEQRGHLILIVDSTFFDTLSFEINRLINDLRGDGWKVYYDLVSRD